MSGLAWLALSWIFAAVLCYFIVYKIGQSSNSKPLDPPSYEESISKSQHAAQGCTKDGGRADASKWANALVNWLHSHSNIKFTPLYSQVINAIDEAAHRLMHEEHFEMRFDKSAPEEGLVDAPVISHLQLTEGPSDQISGRAHVHVPRASLKLFTSKRHNDRFIINNYEAVMSNIHADVDLRVATIAGHAHLIICFVEVPTSEIILYEAENGRVTGSEAVELHDIINKSIGASIINTRLDTLLGSEHEHATNGDPVNDVVKRLYHSHETMPSPLASHNQLHVNVVRAYDLNMTNENTQPYVVVEIDEPQRKHVTSLGKSVNPCWNESFTFDLSNGSDEILFEIYNQASGSESHSENTFLGLAIVGIKELIKTRNPVQYLKLQGRPYHNDDVQGTLLVQFDFSADPSLSLVGSQSSHLHLVNREGTQLSETTTHSVHPLKAGLRNGEPVEAIPTRTTTLTLKGVQRPSGEEHLNLKSSGSYETYSAYDMEEGPYGVDGVDRGKRQPSSEPISQSTVIHRNLLATESGALEKHYENHQHVLEGQMAGGAHETPVQEGQSRSFTMDPNDMPPYMTRPLSSHRSGSEKRKRERSFFGDLKDRLNKKRRQYGRSKSADPATPTSLQETESCPPSRDQSQGPCGREYDDHARYTGDDSKCTLVLELQRGAGETKYFLIPPSIAREPAAAGILKKGKKLHLCKDHTFVAVKSSCGIVCNACNGKIASGFNKQVYQCRACRMVSHKSCHTHVQSNCHMSNSMKLSLAKDVDWAHYLSHSQIGEYISAENL